jgi:hypothetical protein
VNVVRVMDARTRRLTDVPARRRQGMLALCVDLACAEGIVRGTDVRALLIGDVLVRALETRGVQVLQTLARPQLSLAQTDLLRHAASAFGVSPADEVALPGVHTDLHVSARAPRGAGTGAWIEVGVVQDQAVPLPGAGGESSDMDPLAARLVLLADVHSRPVELSPDTLAHAERTLTTWRRQVACWADSPSRPVPRDVRDRADAALADDLGTPGVLQVLRRVEADETVPDGAKFETFALLDRVLGLELAREVGRAWVPAKER